MDCGLSDPVTLEVCACARVTGGGGLGVFKVLNFTIYSESIRIFYSDRCSKQVNFSLNRYKKCRLRSYFRF